MRRYLIFAFASMVVVAAAADAPALSLTPLSAGVSNSQVVLVQDKRDETLKQKVKRIWRDWTGYKFDVACPIFPIPLIRSTCTETGKNREDARAKCQARNPFCSVTDARRS
jgi:hypothetical protein